MRAGGDSLERSQVTIQLEIIILVNKSLMRIKR